VAKEILLRTWDDNWYLILHPATRSDFDGMRDWPEFQAMLRQFDEHAAIERAKFESDLEIQAMLAASPNS